MNTKHDPAIVTAALAGLEVAIREAVALAPEAARELQAISGTHIAIEFTEPEIEVFISIGDDGEVSLASYSEDLAQTRVRGPLASFTTLVTAEDAAATLINSDIEVIGNTAPLLELQDIFASMEIDWEAPLVDRLGDVAGHQLAESLRGLFRWGSDAAQRLRRQLSEFILEEGRLSPPKAELEDHFRRIHALTLKVDRLESLTRRLADRLDTQSS